MSAGQASEEPEGEPSSEDVLWALHHLVVAAAALDVTLGRRLNLGPSEYLAMKHLLTAERPLGPVELGALVGLTSGSSTTLVDRLEHAGHLVRHRDSRDRRRLALEPTADAIDNVQRQMRPLEDALGAVLVTYPVQDRRTIARFLHDAIAAYEIFNADHLSTGQAVDALPSAGSSRDLRT